MKSKKILSLLLAGTMALGCAGALSGCRRDTSDSSVTSKDEASTKDKNISSDDQAIDLNETPGATGNETASTDTIIDNTNKNDETDTNTSRPKPQDVKKDTVNKIGYQLEKPQKGDQIAVIHTTMGDITLRLFPENAPKTVENFISLAKDGKYNGVIFHRVINDFMIQTGDYENGDGTGGKSIWGNAFEDEFCDTLYNIRGSVAMANSGINTNGSQFFINQKNTDGFTREYYDYDTAYNNLSSLYQQFIGLYGEEEVLSYYPTLEDFIDAYAGGINPLSYAVPEEVWKLYEENGGNMHLDGSLREKGGHTVFAQVIEGMDVVDKIAAAETDDNSKPKTDITITSVEITKY